MDSEATSIGCFDPDHHDGTATVIARDEMVGCLVAFCEDHREEWLAKDHITEVRSA